MSEQERWERAIAIYRQSYRDLLVLAIHLIETGRDLSGLVETVDGLSEREAKSLLKVVIASNAEEYTEKQQRSRLN